jgi:hypothetical protein
MMPQENRKYRPSNGTEGMGFVDWDKDDDGNWIEPAPPPIDDPNQLCLPFIFDEIGIKKIETENPCLI